MFLGMISASFSSNRPSNLGCKSLVLRSSLLMLSCWDDLVVLQEMLVTVGVRDFIRNASSSLSVVQGGEHVIMLLRVVQCSGEVFVKLLEDNGLVLHEHTLLLFDLDNHASLGKALHQQGLVSQNILQVSCSLHAPLASRQAQFLSGKCRT